MRSHRPRARHGIPCERGYSGRAKRSRRNPHVCSSNFVEGETFQARLERGPLPQHDGMGLGPAIASGLTAYTAIRSSSNRFSQLASWFRFAKMRLTKSVLFVIDNLLAASPSRARHLLVGPGACRNADGCGMKTVRLLCPFILASSCSGGIPGCWWESASADSMASL